MDVGCGSIAELGTFGCFRTDGSSAEAGEGENALWDVFLREGVHDEVLVEGVVLS